MILRGSLVCLTSGFIWGCLGSIQLARAQTPIVPDNSLPVDSQVIQEGNLFRIQGGTLNEAGTNLFHSFEEFSVPTGIEARFENSQTLESIFTRITGNLPSDIDGILSAAGNANLFLLNPNGIVFGENAQLNLGGSFFATTADSVEFDNGGSFSASFPENPPLLTLSTPRGLQYGTNPGDIVNRSRSQPPNFPPNSIGTPAGLTVRPGRSLILAGGDVNLDGGNLTALSGRIEIGSLGDSESVGLSPNAEGWTLDYEGTTRFGSITLTNESVVDVSSFPAIAPDQPMGPSGNIQISGNQVFILDAGVTGSNFGIAPGGVIDITASQLEIAGSVEMGQQPPPSDLPEENMVSTRIPAGIFSQTQGVGRAGDITLNTEQLQLRDGAQISVSTFNAGAAGSLRINSTGSIDLSGINTILATTAEPGSTGSGGNLEIATGSLELQDGAQIAASTAGSGEAGNVQIRASELVQVTGGGVGRIQTPDNQTIERFVPSAILSQVQPGAQGNGGTLRVETPRLDISNQAEISSSTGSIGNAGDIQLRSDHLLLDGGGQIRSSTVVLPRMDGMTSIAGDGGAVDINADRIEVFGISPRGFPSGIFSQSQFQIPPTPDMAPPNPNVLANLRAGRAGDLTIQTRDMLLRDGGAVSADTFLDGQGGSIAITASDRIELTGRSALPSGSPAADPDGRLPSRITAQTIGTGNAGGVTLNSPFLAITDGAQVGVDARLGGGAAGDVTLNIPDIRLQNNGRITGETASGQGGNLRFTSQDIRLLDDSNISTTAGTADLPGDGGNITINTNTLVGLGNSNISANAFDGSGGVIEITTEGLFGLQVRSRQDLEQLSDNLIEFDPRNLDSNDITAISRTNPDLSGLVNLNTPEVDPVSALVELEDRPVNAAVDQNPCIQGSETELVVTGGGGLPPSANDPFSGTGPWQDLRLDPLDDPQSHDNLPDESPQARSPSPQRIRQAQDWTLNAEGELVLTAPDGGSDYRPPTSEQNCSPQSQLPQSDKQNRPQSQQNQEFQVQNFHFVGNTVFSDEELAAETQNLLNRPLSFEELQTAANTITKHYEDKGYITSGAYIPPQTTENRVVTVQILEGTLEDIQVRTSGNLNPNYVVRRIERVVVGPVNQGQLIEALQLLQLDPHIDRLSAELAAGVQPGTNLLKVQVEEPNAVTVSLGLDNDRSPTVGSFRQQANSGIANLFGIGDVASLAYGNTEGTGNWNLGYQLPVNALDGTVSLLYSTGESRIVEAPFDQVDIQADTRTYEVSYRQPLLRQVQPRRDEENASTASDEGQNSSPPSDYVFREFALGLTASRRDTQTSILDRNFPLSPGADNQGETNISVLRFFQDWTQRDSREVLALRSELSLGVDWFGATVNDDDPDSQFLSWQGQAQWVRRLGGGLETQQPETRLVLRGNAQLSADSLVPIEQFSLGGRRRMRGYRQDVLLADSGLFASAEVQIPLFRFARRQGTVWLAPFVEAGTVWNLGDRPNPDTSSLASAGLGLRLQLGDRLSAAFDWGIPLVELDTGNDSLQDNGLYFSIRFNPL